MQCWRPLNWQPCPPQTRYLGKEYTALSLEDILKEIALDRLDTDTKEWLRGVGLIKGWEG